MKAQNYKISAEGRVRFETSDVRDVSDLVNEVACEYLGEDNYRNQMPDFDELQVGDYVGVEFEEDDSFSISVELVEVELTIIEQIAQALYDARMAHTVASTGSVYVKTPRSEEYSQIRIADHDANSFVASFEIDVTKVSSIQELISTIQVAVQTGSFDELEQFQF